METYQDLESRAAESKSEFDSIIFQIEEMETQILQMQMSVIKLKTYICGSLSYEQFGETR
jgi:hypothetical protein